MNDDSVDGISITDTPGRCGPRGPERRTPSTTSAARTRTLKVTIMMGASEMRRGRGGNSVFSLPESMYSWSASWVMPFRSSSSPRRATGLECWISRTSSHRLQCAVVLRLFEMDRGKTQDDARVIIFELVGAADVRESAAEITGVQAGEAEQLEVLDSFPCSETPRARECG